MMKFAKFAAPVLSTLVLFAGAIAVADAPASDGSTDATMTLCVIGSDSAYGTSCTISAGGDVLGGAYLVPGDNYITVAYPSVGLDVGGDEVLGVKQLGDTDPGLDG